MLTLTSFTAPPASLTTFSISGPSCLHGPHHGAQKSTMTGTLADAAITSCSNVSSVESLMTSAAAALAFPAPISWSMMCPYPFGLSQGNLRGKWRFSGAKTTPQPLGKGRSGSAF